MKKYSIHLGVLIAFLFINQALAQYVGDAFRFSEIVQTGTARFQGLGGNHTALGADASTISGNPAGVGFYNRSELSLSPSVTPIRTQATYIGQTVQNTKANPNFATASLVIAGSPHSQNRSWRRTNFGISFSRQQSFQNTFGYSGQNNRSTHSSFAATEATRQNRAEDAYFDENQYDNATNTAYSLDAAYYHLYLIDPTTAVGPPYVPLNSSLPSKQVGTVLSTGAHTQWTFAYAGNYEDRLYLGVNVGFNRINYNYTHGLQDQYQSSPFFRSSTFTEALSVNGNGFNLTLGSIYKISSALQVGATLSTPTFTQLSETYNQNVEVDYIRGSIRNQQGQDVGPSVPNIPVAPNDFEYNISSPFRLSGGATYFLGGSGFLTASVEYVNYRGMNVTTRLLTPIQNSEFQQGNKSEILDLFSNAINVRVGGEFRKDKFRARAGAAYLSDPYRIQLDGISRTKLALSGGLGLRNDRFFADLSGTFLTFASVFNPYVLPDSRDYASASITNLRTNFTLSLGTFF